MFSKANRTTVANGPSETKNGLKSDVPSIISADMKITGSLESAGDVQLDGRVEGDVNSRTLTVSESATVNGSITAESVRVAGMVKGGINAKTVTLTRTARVEGDIIHETIAIELGANFEGQCKRTGVARSTGVQRIIGMPDGKPETRADNAGERSFAVE